MHELWVMADAISCRPDDLITIIYLFYPTAEQHAPYSSDHLTSAPYSIKHGMMWEVIIHPPYLDYQSRV